MKIFVRGRNEDGVRSNVFKDITPLCGAVTLQGEVKAASRKMTFEVLREKMDYYLSQHGTLNRGDGVILSDSDTPDPATAAFYGLVWAVSEDDANVHKTVTCYDSIKFLMTSDCITNVWTDVTAAEVTQTVCKELGVTFGKVPETDVKVNVNARDRSGYEAIMIAWTETRKQTKKFYYPRMVGYRLDVIEKGEMLEGHDLKYQSEPLPGRLISVQKEEDSASAITSIWERNGAGTARWQGNDEKLEKLYGYIVGVNDLEAQSTKQDSVKAFNDGKKVIEVSAVGDWAVQTGWSVQLISNVLTANQLYIERDLHIFENGLHTMSLTLSYENTMDEIENQEVEAAGSDGVSGNTVEEKIWNFLRANGFTAEAAAGAMGNMFAESGMIVDVEEYSGGGGYGLCQWTGSRRTDLVNWCKNNGYSHKTLEGQLNFLMYELKARNQLYLRDIKNVEEATRKWLSDFEVAGIIRWNVRINAAMDYWSRWHNYKQIPTAGGAGQGDGIATGNWHHPVPSCYAAWKTYGGHTNNAGDLPVPVGTPVVACDGGTVVWTQDWDGRGYGQYGYENASYGNCIKIDHGNGRTSLYAHLHQKFFVRGAKVSRGQQIGTNGSTGNSTGPHLHLEIVVNGVGIYPGNIKFSRS